MHQPQLGSLSLSFIFSSVFSSLASSRCLYLFSFFFYSFILTLWSAGTVKSSIRLVNFFSGVSQGLVLLLSLLLIQASYSHQIKLISFQWSLIENSRFSCVSGFLKFISRILKCVGVDDFDFTSDFQFLHTFFSDFGDHSKCTNCNFIFPFPIFFSFLASFRYPSIFLLSLIFALCYAETANSICYFFL